MIDHYGLYEEDPVAILKALLEMRERKDRGRIGFDDEDLNTIAKAWEKAMVAGLGNKDFASERDKFERFRDDLRNGMHEHGTIGITQLEARDWPKADLIRRAVEYLEYADIRSIH